MRVYLLFLLSVCWLPALTQTNVVKMNAVKSNNYGVTYFLPKTVLVIEAEFSKIQKKAGPYAKYAEKYLGVSDAVIDDQIHYSLDKINVISKGIPNKEEGYLIEFKQKTTAPYVYLTKDGLLCTINAEYGEEDTFAGSVSKKKSSEVSALNPESALSEEYFRAGSVTKQAEVVAKQIYRIRESRTDILTGELENAPRDGEAMKIILEQLETQEKALTEMFTGITTVEKQYAEFELMPETDIDKEIIFRFSKYLGVVEPDDLSGSPVYLNLKKQETPPPPETNSKKDKKGLVYNLPGKASVAIFYGKTNLFEGNVQVTQFGITQTLATSIFEDKKAPIRIYFYPETGAIKQIIQ